MFSCQVSSTTVSARLTNFSKFSSIMFSSQVVLDVGSAKNLTSNPTTSASGQMSSRCSNILPLAMTKLNLKMHSHYVRTAMKILRQTTCNPSLVRVLRKINKISIMPICCILACVGDPSLNIFRLSSQFCSSHNQRVTLILDSLRS